MKQQWPADKVERWEISKLIPYARNSRVHSQVQIDQLAASIETWGWTMPCLVSEDGVLIAGHGRILAARQLGIEYIPVMVAKGWTDAQVKAYRIADNKLTENSEWDLSMLALEIEDLRVEDFDLSLTGFNEEELEAVIGTEEQPSYGDEDTIPDPSKNPVSKRGDIWLLGNNRLMCGDATITADVAKLMNGILADAVLTDPPYGQNQDGVPGDEPENLEHVIKVAQSLPVIDASVVAFQSPRTFPSWLNECLSAGHRFERMLWLYKRAQNSYPWRGWLLTSEAIVITALGKPKWNDAHPYVHDCYLLAEVSGELPDGVGWHGSVKPISVVKDILSRITAPNNIVYDPFLGSGTTMIAAEQLGRCCYAMELSPDYVDIAVMRWEEFTGKSALLESTGEPFKKT